VLRTELRMSYPEIGAVFHKHHTTILHGIKVGKMAAMRAGAVAEAAKVLEEAAKATVSSEPSLYKLVLERLDRMEEGLRELRRILEQAAR
jgi:hypothetical protein